MLKIVAIVAIVASSPERARLADWNAVLDNATTLTAVLETRYPGGSAMKQNSASVVVNGRPWAGFKGRLTSSVDYLMPSANCVVSVRPDHNRLTADI
jgi:hypothetical protein